MSLARAARMTLPPLVLVVLVLLALAARAAVDPVAVGEAVVDSLAKGDVDGVYARFDATMAGALPKEKLATVWASLTAQVGPFKGREAGSLVSKGTDSSPALVTVRCSFEKADLLARVAVAADGKVAGLFFAPAPSRAAWSAPEYVTPGSFTEREVTAGAPGWPLPATLAMPAGKGPFPAVVLVHGSGPHDRDEAVGGARPFRDLAQGLASRGIAVLRYEKRTKALGQKLAREKPDLTVADEVLDDAVAAAALLRTTAGVDPARVFVLGHSLGGTLAPEIARRDGKLAGIVVLAGATRPIEELIVEQTAYILKQSGTPEAESRAKLAEVEAEVAKLRDPKSTEAVLGAPRSYWKSLRPFDPLATVKGLKLRVLVLQGERDYQVTMKDFAAWRQALAGRTDATLKSFPRLNHLFVAGDGPSVPSEYERPGHVAREVVDEIASWVPAAGGAAPPRG
ncbi:alpha/beta fold hydrolase [Acidobacteria bacterium ACD]|nr:alpha/beta fold hydrolase [Acidobacteria bacterium ACD]